MVWPCEQNGSVSKNPRQTLHAKVIGKRSVGEPRSRRVDYIKDLRLRSSEMQFVLVD